MLSVDLLWGALRALGFVAAFHAAGGALFLGLFADRSGDSTPALRRFTFQGALLALLLVAARMILEPARMTGSVEGIWDATLHAIVHGSSAGSFYALQLLGLLLIVLGLGAPDRLRTAGIIIGATLTAASFAAIGHVTTDPARSLLVGLLVVHVLVVAFWFGALLPLYVVAGRATAPTAAALIDGFSRLALWLVPVLFLAGLGIALALVPSLSALLEPYGLLLLAKVGAFGLILGLAALNKWRLGPAVASGSPAARRAFRLSLAVEWVFVAAVLAVTAVMTGFFSP